MWWFIETVKVRERARLEILYKKWDVRQQYQHHNPQWGFVFLLSVLGVSHLSIWFFSRWSLWAMGKDFSCVIFKDGSAWGWLKKPQNKTTICLVLAKSSVEGFIVFKQILNKLKFNSLHFVGQGKNMFSECAFCLSQYFWESCKESCILLSLATIIFRMLKK